MKLLRTLGIGPIGLTIALVTNLAGWFIFHRASSHFFTSLWWSAWFPNYVIWFAFCLVRLVPKCWIRGKGDAPAQGDK